MKKLFFTSLFFLVSHLFANPIQPDCTFKGKKLQGKIRIVTANEDIRVRVVNANENFRVYLNPVTWQERCGEWHFVETNEDFRIRFVDANEDFRIRYVIHNPGL
jgi:hypothetical protein